MPNYLLDDFFTLKTIWPVILTAFILGLICIIFVWLSKSQENKWSVLLFLFSFSVFGIVTGFITGFSRESAVGAVLPAVLSLIGALTIYIISKNKEKRSEVGLIVLIFSISLFIGINWGSNSRYYNSESKNKVEYRINEIKKEAFLEEYKRYLHTSHDNKTEIVRSMVLGKLFTENIDGFKTDKNFPGFSIVSVNHSNNKYAKIHVKSQYYYDWDSFLIEDGEYDFVILVALNMDFKDKSKESKNKLKGPEFYVFPKLYLNDYIDQNNKLSNVSRKNLQKLEEYKGKWELISEFIK